MIRVEYDGKPPTTCTGTLKIYDNEELIYDGGHYSCFSTGSCYVDEYGGEHIESGELLWKNREASKFPQEVQDAVRQKLSEYEVCCGGCL